MKHGNLRAALVQLYRFLSFLLLVEVQVLLREMASAVPNGGAFLQLVAMAVLADTALLRQMRPTAKVSWAFRCWTMLLFLTGHGWSP